MHWVFLAGAMVAAVAGQGLLKAGVAGTFIQQLLNTRTITGLGFYGLSALLYIVALRRIPISVALPCTALSYLGVAAMGYTLFGESMGPQRLAGLACITVGVVVLATS